MYRAYDGFLRDCGEILPVGIVHWWNLERDLFPWLDAIAYHLFIR